MPLPPNSAAPWDAVNLALNTARARLNDAIAGLGGDVLINTADYTQAFTNGAWRRLQGFLASLGFSRLKNETILYSIPPIVPIPPAVVVDPASEAWIDWSQTYDGYVYHNQPTLPADMISPLEVWERVTAAPGGAPRQFVKMDELKNGLPSLPKIYRSWSWQWRNDKLYIQGALSQTDLWIYYAALLPDFVDEGNVPYFDQPIPISRALDALAWYICFEVSNSRGDPEAADFETKAVAAAQQLYDREVMQPKSIMKPSEWGKMRDQFTPDPNPAPAVRGKA